jgi:hypothetical protein
MRQATILRDRTLLKGLVCLGLALVLAGCTSVRLIAPYDEQTDKAVTELQRKVETFLIGLERNAGKPAGAYEANVKFYDEARVDLSSIRVRAAAIPKNDITLQQIDLLAENLRLLENLHKQGIPAGQVAPLRSAFNAGFTAILKLEIAKKRGDSS